MSENYEVMTPSSIDTEASSGKYDSPAERVRDAFAERIDREWAIAGDDHPLVETAGTAESLRSSVPEKVQRMLADDLYQDEDVFWREWLQNHVAACVREGKRIVKAAHGEDALYKETKHTHESLDEPTIVRLPKQAHDILPMARDLGYSPAIEFIVDIESRTITTRDNGIAMTTGEAIQVWNEPVESSSGTDFSSAGNKGIGALTWHSIAEDDSGIHIKTKTRREATVHSDDAVPPRDREGYNFFSYLGGIVPLPGNVDDSFYGTEFKIPVSDSYSLEDTKSSLAKYLELSPVKVRWEKKRGTETLSDDEWEPTTFFDQYDHDDRDAPLIEINRPGEFSLALDKPDVVPKSYSDTDTWLVDMPIERNERRSNRLDTMFNDHLQIHNEQGLIVDGPHRGVRKDQVDDLHEDDVPMPTPTADRDRLARGDDHSKFLNHVNKVAMEAERRVASELIGAFFDQPDIETATEFISTNVADFEMALKFLGKHYSVKTKRPRKIMELLIENDDFDVEEDGIVRVVTNKTSRSRRRKSPRPGFTASPPNTRYREHSLWPLVDLFVELQEKVSYATEGNSRPAVKSNRGQKELYHLLNDLDQRIYVAKQISDDRAKVAWNTYPDALVIDVDSYGKWLKEPFNGRKLKNVPFKESNNEDGEYDIPDAINESHSYTSVRTTGDGGELESDPIRLRADKSSTAVDMRPSLDDLTQALDTTDFGDPIRSGDFHVTHRNTPRRVDSEQHRYIVVFPSTSRARNISEHYDWQDDAMLARGNVAQCERLLEYPQVFKPAQFRSFIADQTIPVSDLFEGTHEHVPLRNIRDSDKPLLMMPQKFASHLRLMHGEWTDNYPDGTPERRELAVEQFFDRILRSDFKNPVAPRYPCPLCDDGFDTRQGRSMHLNYCDSDYDKSDITDDDEWRFSILSIGDAFHLGTYTRLCMDTEWDKGQLEAVGSTHRGPKALVYMPTDIRRVGSESLTSITRKRLEKAMWDDVWPTDSDVWGRYFKSRYSNAPEKEMYRLLRSKGVNPLDFKRSTANDRAIGHVLEREVDYDA